MKADDIRADAETLNNFNKLTDEEKMDLAFKVISDKIQGMTNDEVDDLIIEMYDIFMNEPRLMVFDSLEDTKPYCMGLCYAYSKLQERGVIEEKGGLRCMPRPIFDPHISGNFMWIIDVGFAPKIPDDMKIDAKESREYIIPNYIHCIAVTDLIRRKKEEIKEASKFPVNPIIS